MATKEHSTCGDRFGEWGPVAELVRGEVAALAVGHEVVLSGVDLEADCALREDLVIFGSADPYSREIDYSLHGLPPIRLAFRHERLLRFWRSSKGFLSRSHLMISRSLRDLAESLIDCLLVCFV